MPSSPAAPRTLRMLATGAIALALVAACSNATTSPRVASASAPPSTANPTEAPTPAAALTPAATPAASHATTPGPLVTTLAHAPYGPCPNGRAVDGCLIPGTYRLGPDVVATAVSPIVVPAGWFEWDMGPGTEGLLVDRPDENGGSGWGVLFSSVGLVSRDPCDSTKGTFPVSSASSVNGLLAAMTSWPGFEVGSPQSITLGGVTGKQVAVTSTKTTAVCPAAVVWQTPQGTGFDGYPMVAEQAKRYTAEFMILDVAGAVLVIRTTDFPGPSPAEVSNGVAPDPGRHLADQETLHSILDSIRFGAPPAP